MRSQRRARISRHTRETKIELELNLDGRGRARVSTGIRFFDHMIEAMAMHGGFDLNLTCTGDLDVDQHHTIEDVGLALGSAFREALGDRKGIHRAGYFLMPMDETLAAAAVDFSGRPHAVTTLAVRAARVGDLQTELVADFMDGLALGAQANVHVKTIYGRSSHHKIEAIFKALARALRAAAARDPRLARVVPSTKGKL